MKQGFLWLAALVLWLGFTYWYTNTGGPLTEAEIEHFLEHYGEQARSADFERIRTFMREDTGKQFLMLNLLDYNENPPTVEGAEAGEDAQSLLGRYMEFMYPALLKRACHPIWAGRAVAPAMDLVGIDGAEQWDTAALMRYRSRRDLLEIATNPEFNGRHEFKLAALAKTIAFPTENQLYLADPRLLLGLVLLTLCALSSLLLSRR